MSFFKFEMVVPGSPTLLVIILMDIDGIVTTKILITEEVSTGISSRHP